MYRIIDFSSQNVILKYRVKIVILKDTKPDVKVYSHCCQLRVIFKDVKESFLKKCKKV